MCLTWSSTPPSCLVIEALKVGGKKGHIKNRIKIIRVSQTDWTQADLAKRVGATRQTIIAIEAGKYAPSMVLAFRIVQAFDARFEDVFQFEP